MTDQIQCPGCASRFRLRLRNNAPVRAELACPRCGTTISMQRPQDKVDKQRPIKPPEPEETLRTGIAGWRTVDHSSVFGRPAPPPPTRQQQRPSNRSRAFVRSDGPRLGLFGGKNNSENNSDSDNDIASTSTPRLPEDDGRESGRPLASTLLRELRQQRAEAAGSNSESATATTLLPPEAPRDDTADNTTSDDPWLDDDFIAEAADAATDELYFTDDNPPAFDRLRGAYADDDNNDADADAEAIVVETNRTEQTAAKSSPPPTPPIIKEEPTVVEEPAPTQDPAPEPEQPPEPEPIPEPEPEPVLRKQKPAEKPIELTLSDAPDEPEEPTRQVPTPDTMYSLRIGDETYGDIAFEGLLSLFRRGIWVVADEIAEDNGPWIPVESHPIFDRVRHAIADGLTNRLATYGRLIDDGSGARQIPTRPPRSAETTRSNAPPSPPATPSQQQDSEPAAQPVQTSQSDKITINTSSGPALPWTIALITTGLASAAVTFALLAGPLFLADTETSEPSAVAAPAEIEGDSSDPMPLNAARRAQVEEARTMAVKSVAQAATVDNHQLAASAIDRGDFNHSRRIVAEAYATSSDSKALQEVFTRAIVDDPELRLQLRTMTADRPTDNLRALGGGASVTLRFTSRGESRFAFKVDRNDWRNSWKVEVAAFKLCQLIPCDLYVPVNEAARISREDFNELYGRVDTQRQRSYADERFDELIWGTEAGPDGVEREYLYGTLKEWIPRYTNWPIEYTETWEHWLDIERDESVFDEDFADFLDRLDERYDRRFTSGLRREAGDTSTRELTRQLSNLHVFDYLTSNFDRYSGIEDYYGVNAHFADGRFVPLDNSAAFQFVDRPVLEGRLQRIQRFSRPLIDAIRLLTPEAVDPIFFPNATEREQERLRIFWERRDQLLAHVDQLVEEYGEERVFPFGG